MQVNKVEINYSPYPHQVPIHESKARFIALMQPVRSGKDYASVAEAAKKTIARKDEWSARTEMSPRWNLWAIAPTMNPGGRQLWDDLIRVFPYELIRKINKSENIIYLHDDGKIQLKSADEPEKLVSEAVDLVLGTEVGLWKPDVWKKVRSRLSSVGRFGQGILNGTPTGQVDKENPKKLHHWWRTILNGRNPDMRSEFESFYWFEDKLKPEYVHPELGILNHPILSRTPEGRAELQKIRESSDIDDRTFRQDYLGECLPVIAGKSVTPGFAPAAHSMEFQYAENWDVHVTIDFGGNYPFAHISQYSPDGIWYIIDEFNEGLDVDYLQDKDFIEALLLKLKNRCPRARNYYYYGDFEANQKTDQRPENTAEMMRKEFGITLQTQPTLKSDEKLAIDTINGHLKFRQDQRTGLVVHPRCIITTQGFLGGFIFKTRNLKIKGVSYEAIEERVAEIHPYIDCFDSLKYMVMHVIKPSYDRKLPQQASSFARPAGNYSESGMPISSGSLEGEDRWTLR